MARDPICVACGEKGTGRETIAGWPRPGNLVEAMLCDRCRAYATVYWRERQHPMPVNLLKMVRRDFFRGRQRNMRRGESLREARARWRGNAGQCSDCGEYEECTPCRERRRARERATRR